MSTKLTKQVKIGDKEITMTRFDVLKALKLRGEIVFIAKNNLDNFDKNSEANMISSLASIIYQIPADLLMKLFENCACIDIGQLSNEENFKKCFSDNIDGPLELALEVLEFNGFFTTNTISIICKKIPILAPMEEALLQTFQSMKSQ